VRVAGAVRVPRPCSPRPDARPERRDILEDEREDVIRELAGQFLPVFRGSPDGVYPWLDEANKACNGRLAGLFGFSVEEWCATQPFLDNLVAEADRSVFS
jgi:hypothetical protein